MKTKLPEKIESIKEAQIFLLDLIKNGEIFHPEDDAHNIIWKSCKPSYNKKCQLNILMEDIYNLKGNENARDMIFDPCEFILKNAL